jgi:hypothetical protein
LTGRRSSIKRKLKAAPASIPKKLRRLDVPLDPAPAVADRFSELAARKA